MPDCSQRGRIDSFVFNLHAETQSHILSAGERSCPYGLGAETNQAKGIGG
jgi:hypothetical protein